jgi:hypothetical protein
VAAPISLRPDYDGPGLRALARQSRDANQTRRLLALASIYDGGSRSAAAKLGGVGLQIVRDWVPHFNAEGPDGLISRKAPGQVPKLNDTQRQELAEKVERGPIPAVDGVVRWRLTGPMGVRGVRHLAGRINDEPHIEGDGVSQAFGPPPALRPERRGH